MEKNIIIDRLGEKQKRKEAIFGTTTSSGLITKIAAQIPIDFAVVHKESIFGMDGRLPLLARIGYGGNCNKIVEREAENILRFADELPVVVGIGAAEPYYNIDSITEKLLARGYSGITHIPTSGGWVGDFGEAIDKGGCGYRQEVHLIEHWSKKGIFTVGYCFGSAQIQMMGAAGASVLAIYIPGTDDESYGWKKAYSEAEALEEAERFVEVARCENPQAIVMITSGYDGNTPQIQEALYKTKASGYLGNEIIEGKAVYRAISGKVAEYKKLSVGGQQQ